MKLPWSKSERPGNASFVPDVKPAKRRRRRRSGLSLGLGTLLLVLGFTVATTAAGLYTVFSQYQVVKVGYAIDQQLFDYRRELEANKRLQLSISSYKHPSAVRAFADEALDMRQPGNADELIVPVPKKPAAKKPAAKSPDAAPSSLDSGEAAGTPTSDTPTGAATPPSPSPSPSPPAGETGGNP